MTNNIISSLEIIENLFSQRPDFRHENYFKKKFVSSNLKICKIKTKFFKVMEV